MLEAVTDYYTLLVSQALDHSMTLKELNKQTKDPRLLSKFLGSGSIGLQTDLTLLANRRLGACKVGGQVVKKCKQRTLPLLITRGLDIITGYVAGRVSSGFQASEAHA